MPVLKAFWFCGKVCFMTEREAVVVSNFKYPDDYLGRAKLLEETGLFNPVRDTPSRVQETINKRPNAIKVAKRLGSDAVIGTVFIGDGIGLVEALAVDPEWRDQGVGSSLLREAEDELKSQGYDNLEVQVDPGQDDLDAWYKKRGFKVAYETRGMIKFIKDDDRYVDIFEEGTGKLDRERVRHSFEKLYFMMRTDYTCFYFLDTRGVTRAFRDSPFPTLHTANIVAEDEHVCFTATPYYIYASADDPNETSYFVQWAGRSKENSEILLPNIDESMVPYEEACYPLQNTVLILRRVEVPAHYGEVVPDKSRKLGLDGMYVACDQANNDLFSFEIESEEVRRLSPEDNAKVLESMVACAEITSRDYRRIVRP